MADARKDRIPELDGLRVLMIAMVAWFHIWQQSWLFPDLRLKTEVLRFFRSALGLDVTLAFLPATGYIWVDGTVLISVFLLYLPWAKAKREGTPAPRAGDFYFRRARRILPSYYFILLCHLLLVALPWNQYDGNRSWMVRDILSHLTFTFMQRPETYIATPLGGGAWTVALLVQGYLLFPLMARGMQKHPAAVAGGMLLCCFAYRTFVLWSAAEDYAHYGVTPDYSMQVNQLINFLDVYVIGALSAAGFDAARALQEKNRRMKPLNKKRRLLREAAMTLLFLGSLYGLLRLLQIQARADGIQLQAWQMMYRPAFALCFAGMIVTAPFALRPLRFLLGNPVTRFLAGISMNFYLVHQTVAVHLKYRLHLPWSDHFLSEDFLVWGMYPNQVMNEEWMVRYSLLCVAVAFVMALAVTYLVEKPISRLAAKRRAG